MSKSLEVRQVLKKINTAQAEIAAIRRNARAEISNVSLWWKGNASKSFIGKYGEIDRDILTLEKKIDELRFNTDKLMKLLEEEERESKLLARKMSL